MSIDFASTRTQIQAKRNTKEEYRIYYIIIGRIPLCDDCNGPRSNKKGQFSVYTKLLLTIITFHIYYTVYTAIIIPFMIC